MKNTLFTSLFILLLIFSEAVFSQARITVTKPRLEASDDNLIIEYDILNAGPTDFFVVWIEITDAAGNKINAVSLTGDVGQEIKGGSNKRITWNLANDKIIIDEELYVEVKAEKIAIQEKAETKTSEEKTTAKKDESTVGRKTISKGNMFISSVVFPGWGQSKLKKGKPYWLLGIAGYGCLGGSVYLNRMASSSYNDYKKSLDTDEFNSLYDKAVKQDKLSKYMVYSGIGIWAADLIWVLATSTESTKSTASREDRKLRIIPCYDTFSNSTMVSLTYRF